MREIKFRAWDKKSKKMRQVTEIVFNTGFYLEPNDNTVKLIWVKGQDIIENKEIQLKRENDFILMQYTGLHDKNGNEIYEGDIVKHDGFYEGDCYYNAGCGQVLWDDENTGFYLTAKDTSFISLFDLTRNLDGEVIGNIYDNPELLEVE